MQCQLIEALFRAIQSIHQEQYTARDYGAGGPLYHAELSLLEMIQRHPQRSASDLAALLGVTRGAVTQTAKKLIDKGLIEQYSPPDNRKTRYHRLTADGETARRGHKAFHAAANARARDYLCALPTADKRVLMDFFTFIGSGGQVCLYDCNTTGCMDDTDPQGGNTDAGA